MLEAFYDALRAGDVDRLVELLATGADPSMPFQSHYGHTPLQIAVAELEAVDELEPGGPIDAVVLLLRHGARVNDWDEGQRTTALLKAVMINHIEAVRILLAAGADPNVRGEEGDSPLRFCAQHGYLEMARLLLHCGADKTIHEAGGSAGMNALGLAATWFHLDMVRLLLAHGADPWVEDVDRMNVFDNIRHVPSRGDARDHERFEQIRRLFDDMKARGPSPMESDGKLSDGGRSDAGASGKSMSEALLDVLKAGDVDRLAELLASGEDPNKPFRSRYGISYNCTPLQVAVAELEAVAELRTGGPIEAVVLLLRHGARVNDWGESRDATPLLIAVYINHIEAVRILLAAGADPNVSDDEGDSPLRWCAQHGYLEMARLLLRCGADKTIHEAGGSAGMNALGLVVNRLNLDMVRLLLAHGADPWVEDLDRMHVFDHLRILSRHVTPANQERFEEVCRLLDDMKARGPSPMALERNKKRYL